MTNNSSRSAKNSHCSYCGVVFPADLPYPRTCPGCRQISYLNPLPVTVTLVPVGKGLLAVRRTIEPGLGKLALPGGFMEAQETWQESCVRELREETGLVVDPAEVTLFQVASVAEEGVLLLFGMVKPRRQEDLSPFRANAETSEIVVLSGPVELAFPTHTQVVREFFQSE